jgi:23S rRNA pseudouridine1911/1915/1917 synthase
MKCLELWVDDLDAEERLDRWLSTQVPYLSRSRLQKLIEQEQVQVNGQPCKVKKYSVQAGDRIQVTLPDLEPLALQPEPIPLDILYEDDQLLILNKPAGMVVHPAPGHATGTLVNALLAYCGDRLSGIGGVQRPGIVHRLDKDTSGAIAIAKTDVACQALQDQFREKTAGREYVAIVFGAPTVDEGVVDQPIGRHPIDRLKMAIVPEEKGGRSAITLWQVEERLGNYAVIRLRLKTGRTHQIRVHMAALGHPVVGDPLYSANRSVGVNLQGQALHAEKLRLCHPVTQHWIEAIAPLPEEFVRLRSVLRKRANS